LWWPSLTKDM